MFFFLRIILKRTSTEAYVYMIRHQGAKVRHFDVINVIYHKFSHGTVFYTLNGENVNVMLEYLFYRAVKLNAGVFFAEKICLICISRNGNLNISLTYHIVSFDE